MTLLFFAACRFAAVVEPRLAKSDGLSDRPLLAPLPPKQDPADCVCTQPDAD